MDKSMYTNHIEDKAVYNAISLAVRCSPVKTLKRLYLLFLMLSMTLSSLGGMRIW